MTGPRAFHRVRVARVVAETREACSLVLEVPPELADAFAYRPGQFLTVRVPSGREGSVARCYSLSSSPHAGDPPHGLQDRPQRLLEAFLLERERRYEATPSAE